jgi:hypothetical protein
MRLVALAVAALAGSGCFTTWTVSQAAGHPEIWDERVREEKVPMPGITERLVVTVPLIVELEPARPATVDTPYTPPSPLPFTLQCKADQFGKDAVYHSAFRYGSSWKRNAGIMFLLEAGSAAAFLLLGEEESSDLLWGTLLAADALGTGVIFWLPRKEVYRRDVKGVRTPLRSDCPESLTITIGADTFPVDAAGRIGEVGDLALDDWMQQPSGPLLLSLEGRSHEIVVEASDRCTWGRARQRHDAPSCGASSHGASQTYVQTIIDTTPGTLTRI